MIIGMDFGTTHSGMAVYDGQQLTPIPLHADEQGERITPTILYVLNEQKVSFGNEAIDTYFAQNLGRPVKMEKVWVGEITLTFADLPTFVRDVYIWVDVLSPGRLFLSFKTDLADISYQGTTVGRFFYRLEDIVAIYLNLAKRRAERFLDRAVDEIVLGRPVRFATDPQANALAQERLLDAALRAGYKKVYFEYEPIAAAYYYEMSMDKAQNVLVFDFGGGTLDVTVMRLGDARQRRVLATGGLPLAGDVFDRKLVRTKLPHHFGQGSSYRSLDKSLPVPDWIYDTFADWRTILTLQRPENMQMLKRIAATAQAPQQIEALMSLIASNYSLKMFDVVEKVKRRLSTHKEAVIRLHGPNFQIREPVTRLEFESIIGPEYRAIAQHVDETVHASGLRPHEIDLVIRTGGSSQIPLFQRMLEEKFGADKVRAIDTFGSVTAGLGVIGHRIARGEIEAKAYTQTSRIERLSPERTNIPPVNLDLLTMQLEIDERTATDGRRTTQWGLGVISSDYRLILSEALSLDAADAESVPLNDIELSDLTPYSVVLAQLDEPLLLITSRYRFLLVTLRELLAYHAAGQTVAQVRGFAPGEQMCTLSRWAALTEQPLLVIVSTQGHARVFEMAQMAPRIEGPAAPQIDWNAAGWPKVVLGGAPDHALSVVNTQGRATRTPLSTLPRLGLRVLTKRKADTILDGACTGPEAEIILFSDKGYAKQIPVNQIPPFEEVGAGGASVVRRRGEICGVAPVAFGNRAGNEVWALTPTRLLHIPFTDIPIDTDESMSMHKIVSLGKNATVLRVLQSPGKVLGSVDIW